ncbi:MAG: N-acetylmuramoyl-L-alanine amidase [Pseudomonadota bacterium]
MENTEISIPIVAINKLILDKLRDVSRQLLKPVCLMMTVAMLMAANSDAQAIFGLGSSGDDVSETVNTEPQAPALVSAGRVAGDENSTRLYFDFDRKVEFKSFLMDEPGRVVLDGPSMLFRFTNPDDLEPRGLVSFLRYGAIGQDRSRIVISLSDPAEISEVKLLEIESGKKFRLVIDLNRISEEEFKQSIADQQELLGKSGETAIKGDRLRPAQKKEGHFVIVLDPGHGGIDGGAIGASGVREKDLTLKIAKLLAKKISSKGPFDVKLTRDSDVFLSLRERVNFARRNNADLVISIHADSLKQKWVRGASIYTLSNKASDALAEQLAESENMADIAAGLDNPVEEEVVSGILADLTARETKVFSLAFSSTLTGNLSSGIKMIKNPQRSAGFMVLKAPEVPGVLLELGYLSNAEDEKLLTDPEWQENIVRLIANSVLSFFEPRM